MSRQDATPSGRVHDVAPRRRRARRVRVPRTLVLLLAATIALVVAVATDGDQQVSVADQQLRQMGVSFEVPADWEVIEDDPGSVGVAFASPDGTAKLTAVRYLHSDAPDPLGHARWLEHENAPRPPGWSSIASEDITVGEHAAWWSVEEGPREPGEQQVRWASLLLDAGDGTAVDVHATVELPADVHDPEAILASVADSLSVDDLSLPVAARRLTMATEGVAGEYWIPDDVDGPQPAIVYFGGSEGGYHRMPAAQLARAGHPTLSLAYWSGRPAFQDLPGVPTALHEVPLEYFESAIDWLADQPEVDAERIYLWGGSRGGEGALLVAATFPQRVHGVIANVPSNVAGIAHPRATFQRSAWSFGSEPIPFAPDAGPDVRATDSLSEWEIPVERFDGPILLTCGELDELWPSCPMSRRVVDRLEEHGYPHRVDLAAYPDLGHSINLPPLTLTADPRAGDEAWQRSLEFIDETS